MTTASTTGTFNGLPSSFEKAETWMNFPLLRTMDALKPTTGESAWLSDSVLLDSAPSSTNAEAEAILY